MAVDEELLARSDAENEENDEFDESEMAGDFRAARRGTEDGNEGAGQSLRELKQQQMVSEKSAEASKEANAVSQSSNPMRRATDKLLQAAWEYLIPSWGLTLFWIDIHAFLNKALGPWAFCDLGEEWIPAEARKALGKSDTTKSSVALIKKTEEIGCGCLNLGCLFVLVALLSLVAFIAQALAHPFDTLYQLIQSSFSSFFDLF
ncbi:MAG: hypothetical protein WAW11_01415 [Patescibacteria group bacterium]